MQSIATLPIVGMDIAKNVFQLHVVDAETGEIARHKLRRDRVTTFFANRQRSLVALEACGGAHHWARTLQALKLLPAKHVRPFVLRDKTDAMDAQAIWVAAHQPHTLPVPVKSERQQACLSMHGMRRQMMKMRIMQTNALRGILAEFGIALPVGYKQLLKTVQVELAKAQQADQLSADLRQTHQAHVEHQRLPRRDQVPPRQVTAAIFQVAGHEPHRLGVITMGQGNTCIGWSRNP